MCDTRKDGKSVSVSAYRKGHPYVKVNERRGKGHCFTGSKNLTDGATYTFRAYVGTESGVTYKDKP